MAQSYFNRVDTWVFGLDNTLYHPSKRLFEQIEVPWTHCVIDALDVDRDRADYLRSHDWKSLGNTLTGLMREHDLDPVPYLVAVHNIDISHITPETLPLRQATPRSGGASSSIRRAPHLMPNVPFKPVV